MGADAQHIERLARSVFEYTPQKSTVESIALLKERAPAAEELATLAFRDKDKAAWRALQHGVFHLPIFKVTSGRQADQYRPFFRGDLYASGVRDLIWEIEEKHLEWQKPPRPGLRGEEVAALCEAD